MTAEDLADLVREDLARAGLPIEVPVDHVEVRRLAQAYPIYERGFHHHLVRLNRWLDSLPRVVSLGRQGLFAHDNTHHALRMAYAAVSCLAPDGRFDRAAWAARREEFKAHVVED